MTSFKSFLTEATKKKNPFAPYIGKDGWFLRFSNRKNPWEMPRMSGDKKAQNPGGENDEHATPLGFYGWDMKVPPIEAMFGSEIYTRAFFHFFRVSDSAKILVLTNDNGTKDAPSTADLLRVLVKFYYKNVDADLVVKAFVRYVNYPNRFEDFDVSVKGASLFDGDDPASPLNELGSMVKARKVPKTIFLVFDALFWSLGGWSAKRVNMEEPLSSKKFFDMIRVTLLQVGKETLQHSAAQTKILKEFGYDAVFDNSTKGVIWSMEPRQIVVLNKSMIENTKMFTADYDSLKELVYEFGK